MKGGGMGTTLEGTLIPTPKGNPPPSSGMWRLCRWTLRRNLSPPSSGWINPRTSVSRWPQTEILYIQSAQGRFQLWGSYESKEWNFQFRKLLGNLIGQVVENYNSRETQRRELVYILIYSASSQSYEASIISLIASIRTYEGNWITDFDDIWCWEVVWKIVELFVFLFRWHI
jgi:hypothetical protein